MPMTLGPDNVTVTPGSTALWSSVALPTISPKLWPVWANAVPPIATTADRASPRTSEDVLREPIVLPPHKAIERR